MSSDDIQTALEESTKRLDQAKTLSELANNFPNMEFGGYHKVPVRFLDSDNGKTFQSNLNKLEQIVGRDKQIEFISREIMPYQRMQGKIHIPHLVFQREGGGNIEDESFVLEFVKGLYKKLFPLNYGHIDYDTWQLRGMTGFKYRESLPEDLRVGTAGVVIYCEDPVVMYDLADSMHYILMEMSKAGVKVPRIDEDDSTTWPRYSFPHYVNFEGECLPVFITYGDGDFKKILQEKGLIDEFFDKSTNYATPVYKN